MTDCARFSGSPTRSYRPCERPAVAEVQNNVIPVTFSPVCEDHLRLERRARFTVRTRPLNKENA